MSRSSSGNYTRLFQLFLLLFAVAVLFMPHAAFASTATTSAAGLPWESPLDSVRASFSGPIAYAVSIIAIVVCGALLVWGGEIGEFARRAIMLALVVSLIVLANSVLTSMFTTAEVVGMVSPATATVAVG